MMATLKQRILETLGAELPNGALTNQQLAYRLDANEPSVRRATLELMRRGKIWDYDGGYAGLPVQYKAYEATPTQPAPSC